MRKEGEPKGRTLRIIAAVAIAMTAFGCVTSERRTLLGEQCSVIAGERTDLFRSQGWSRESLILTNRKWTSNKRYQFYSLFVTQKNYMKTGTLMNTPTDDECTEIGTNGHVSLLADSGKAAGPLERPKKSRQVSQIIREIVECFVKPTNRCATGLSGKDSVASY